MRHRTLSTSPVDASAESSFGWNPRLRRYEAVLGGSVVLTISRFGLRNPARAARFRYEVKQAFQVASHGE